MHWKRRGLRGGRRNRRLEEVAEAVGGRLLSVANAIEAGTWRQGDSGWAEAGRPGGGGGGAPPFQCIPRQGMRGM